jgi:hypothetical protein
MNTPEAHEWAKDFENKSISELLDMPSPDGLGGEAQEAWWLARAAAIEALEEAEDAADAESAQSAPSEPASDAGDVIDAEELALAREEQAQQSSVVSRSSMFSNRAPALDDIAPAFARPHARAIRNDGDTEHLLNGLIAECHLLMRAVTLPSAMRAGDADTRQQFLRSAMDMAKVGAKVGRAVAKLRGAGVSTEIRQRHISERVYSGPAPLLENGAKT